MKSGLVALIGRPNAGKSTLLNNILNQKVTITSPKPQTTRFMLEAIFEDERGQILFIDTPGIFAKPEDPLSKKINLKSENFLKRNIDLVLYIVDHSRQKNLEENKALGLVRKATVPKILVVNKADIKKPTHIIEYKFMEDEFNDVIYVSALKRLNLDKLLDVIFKYLPEREQIVDTKNMIQPGLNIDSRLFIEEIIREKAYLFLRREVPYSMTAEVDEITERDNGVLYIKARILTTADRYKIMIIGNKGSMIKEISQAARKELETAGNRKVYLDLTVVTDPHWIERYN